MIGEQIGQYQIVESIGQGGMSTVYRATQPNIGRDVAIKILPRQFSEDPTFLKRFQNEARVIARLEHRSILPVYDYGEHNGIPYIVMRFMDAGTLRRKLFYDGVTMREAIRITEEVAEALDYAHQHGVIHRDLKPSNILLDQNGDAYLSDFGIAKMLGSTSQVTGSGVVGTPNYMSPEQCQGKPLGPASDIYALGTILFEILTGTPPFEADLPLTVMYMHVRDPIPSAYERNPNLPPEIDQVIAKAMAKRAEDRYPSARALVANFRRVVDANRAAVAAAPPVRPPSPPEPPPTDDYPYEEPSSAVEALQAYDANEVNYYLEQAPPYDPSYEQVAYPTPRPVVDRGGRSPILLTVVGGVILLLLMIGAVGLGWSALSGGNNGALFPTRAPTRAAGIPVTDTPTEVVVIVPSITPITPGGILEPSATSQDTPTPTVIPPSNTPLPPTGTRTPLPPSITPTLTPTATLTATPTPTSSPTATATDTPTSIPATGKLVYMEGVGDNAEIVSANANGGGRSQLTDNSHYDGEPDWSPNGAKIVFDSKPGTFKDLYVMNADGSSVQQITSTAAIDERHPDWSPDGSKIVYEAGPEETAEIWVANADGSNPVQITNNSYSDRAPHFSPDGTRIVLMTFQQDKWQITVISYPSGAVVQTYPCSATGCRFPSWSSDGQWIVFNTIDSNGNVADIAQIFVSTGATGVLAAAPDKGRPVYSGDRNYVFFNATSGGNTDLYRINVNTQVIERLTTSGESEYAPDWGSN